MFHPIEPLESRLFLAATPAQVLTKSTRQALLNSLSTGNKPSLQYKLTSNQLPAFDQQLLDYMRDVTHDNFFFDSADVSQIANYTASKTNFADSMSNAGNVFNNRYPEQDGGDVYNVQVPEDIDWDYTGYSSNPETIHNLNRMYHWMDLALAYRYGGQEAYVTKVVNQLGDWSSETPALADLGDWADSIQWSRLNVALRTESLVWTYNLLLTSPQWTKEANTLFLAKMVEHGQFLSGVETAPLTSNQALFHAQALLYVGLAFPVFTQSNAWANQARSLVFSSLDMQFYSDGGHFEQSPNYAKNVIDHIVESKLLDEKNGNTWSAGRDKQVNDTIDAFYQMLSPDARTPAISDTYRSSTAHLFLKWSLVQDQTRWSEGKPRARDVWLLGPSEVDGFMGNPVTPALDDRGRTYALDYSGYYVMRSGSDASARQIIFDAGPRGGGHGHLDLLSFELFGYGRPLIADPGLYRYDSSASRNWALSTPAHNTISIDGASHQTIEGEHNPAIVVDGWDASDTHAQVTAHHTAYDHLAGDPMVKRSIWYDYDGTMLVVDWMEAGAKHDVKTSFLLPGISTTRDLAAGWIRTNNPTGGNVKIQSLLLPGQAATLRTSGVFTSSNPSPNHADPATQFFTYQNGTSYVGFATLITAYNGTTPPSISAEWLTTPVKGKGVIIRLNKNGVFQNVGFGTDPPPAQLPQAAQRGTYNDIAYDSRGTLHLVYFDRDEQNFKYLSRPNNGSWSAIQTIDSGHIVGYDPSIAIDSEDRVGVAYTDADNGDLKYAFKSGSSWTVQSVDVPGSTGHYPSLAFSSDDGAVITYYDKTHGDLKMAKASGSSWLLGTIDSGAIGTRDVGRFSQIALDPTSTIDRWAIAYEDTGGGRYLYAIQGNVSGSDVRRNGYTLFAITFAPKLGGYLSLAFDSSHKPALSFYDSAITGLRFAKSSGTTQSGIKFSTSTVTEAGAVGYYSNLFYHPSDGASILYFDRTRSKAMRATFSSTSWQLTPLADGGRAIRVAQLGSTVSYTSLDESVATLDLLNL